MKGEWVREENLPGGGLCGYEGSLMGDDVARVEPLKKSENIRSP